MKTTLIAVSILTAVTLTGCFEGKVVKGQAYLSLGDKYRGQVMVDFPIYCYGESFDAELAALKNELSAESKRMQTENTNLKAAYSEELKVYFNEVQSHFINGLKSRIKSIELKLTNLESTRDQRIQLAQEKRKSQVDELIVQIQEMEDEQRISLEIDKLLQPIKDEINLESSRIRAERSANVQTEIERANDLIEKINQVIVDKRLCLELYQKFSSEVPENTYYPNGLSAFFRFKNISVHDDAYGRVVFAQDGSNRYVSNLPAPLTPYLSSQIQEAFYKHILIAAPRLEANVADFSALNSDMHCELQIYANKKGMSIAQVKAIMTAAKEGKGYASRIKSEKRTLEAVSCSLVAADVEAEIADLKSPVEAGKKAIMGLLQSTKIADSIDEIYSVLSKADIIDGTKSNFTEMLEDSGLEAPDRPDYLSVNLDVEIELFFRTASDAIVFTDIQGEFVIPAGTTRIFAMLEEDGIEYFWMNAITAETEEVRIAFSTVATKDWTELLFPE
jgi:hypothetical protein